MLKAYYKLNPDKTISECTVSEWIDMYQVERALDKRRIRLTEENDYAVSTVFLGLDHSFDELAMTILFGTMIFCGPLNEYQERCSTYREAVAMHWRAVRRARRAYRNEMASTNLLKF